MIPTTGFICLFAPLILFMAALELAFAPLILFMEPFFADVSSVVFSVEFYHLRDKVGALQSLCQCGATRGHIEHASTRRINLVADSPCSRVIHLHAIDALSFFQTDDLFPGIDLTWIAVLYEHDSRRRIGQPFYFSLGQPV